MKSSDKSELLSCTSILHINPQRFIQIAGEMRSVDLEKCQHAFVRNIWSFLDESFTHMERAGRQSGDVMKDLYRGLMVQMLSGSRWTPSTDILRHPFSVRSSVLTYCVKEVISRARTGNNQK